MSQNKRTRQIQAGLLRDIVSLVDSYKDLLRFLTRYTSRHPLYKLRLPCRFRLRSSTFRSFKISSFLWLHQHYFSRSVSNRSPIFFRSSTSRYLWCLFQSLKWGSHYPSVTYQNPYGTTLNVQFYGEPNTTLLVRNTLFLFIFVHSSDDDSGPFSTTTGVGPIETFTTLHQPKTFALSNWTTPISVTSFLSLIPIEGLNSQTFWPTYYYCKYFYSF